MSKWMVHSRVLPFTGAAAAVCEATTAEEAVATTGATADPNSRYVRKENTRLS